MLIQRIFKNAALCAALLGALAAGACGGGTSGATPEDVVAADNWWETAIPDFSENPDRPVISLVGDNVMSLNIGDAYVEEGATAVDAQDGDLTQQVTIRGVVDTAVARDYLVRYSVTDSSGTGAIEAVRVVRVVDGDPEKLSSRLVGSTMSHLGYIEHLPATYADDPNQSFPLLVFNHGGGAMASTAGRRGVSRQQTLNAVLDNSGPSLVIFLNSWFESDPFIVLSPQTVDLNYEDPIERLDAFIDFAEATYNVDPSRIYVSGWSAGASLSLAHAVLHADRVAAVAPMAPGLLVTNTNIFPNGFCDLADVPMWTFHGEDDETIAVDASIDNHNSIINSCTPAVTPKLTIYQSIGHFIHHETYDLRLMEGGAAGISGDPTYDLYDQTIYDWFLSHSLDDRGVP